MRNFYLDKLSLASVAIFATMLAGCAAPSQNVRQLNDLSRSTPITDIAPLTPGITRPFDVQEKSGLAVSYNLTQVEGGGMTLRLVFRNNSSDKLLVEPKVALTDAAGFVVQAETYAQNIEMAAQMQGGAVTVIPQAQAPSYYNSGTIRSNTTGNTYSYSGYSSPSSGGFASGFAAGSNSVALGLAIGQARAAAEMAAAGRKLFDWVNAFWLKSSYELEPQTAVVGVLTYAERPFPLPLRVRVEAAGNRYEFLTGTGK